jgi:hypothetical protein
MEDKLGGACITHKKEINTKFDRKTLNVTEHFGDLDRDGRILN